MKQPLATVAVCTYGRPDALERCLASLHGLDDPNFEILVVDNAPTSTVPARLVDVPLVRVVHEPRRGLDNARNRAVREARGSFVAFIDDDCEAGSGWLRGLRRGFDDPEVGCVTGRVRPARLDSAPKRWFEDRFSFDRGMEAKRFTASDDRRWWPLFPSPLGTGCNMAFRQGVVDGLGGFDPALDMGSRVGGGGDLDLFARFFDAGGIASYRPEALVYHHHRHTQREAMRQFFGYGASVSTLCVKAALTRPGQRSQAVRFLAGYVRHMLRRLLRWARGRGETVPPRMFLAEAAGLVTGPVLYAVSVLEQRRSA
jgi:GT2 family glycosyltransferase